MVSPEDISRFVNADDYRIGRYFNIEIEYEQFTALKKCEAKMHKNKSPIIVIIILLILFPISTYALSLDEETDIQIYEETSPGVVNIITTIVSYDFFLNSIPGQGAASGSIIDKKGHILTNYHVVVNAKKIEVTLFDGSKWQAEPVGVDSGTDLAVIKINAPVDKLKPIPFGDSSNLKVGQKVLAIGNPFGLERTLTVGIVSSLGRTLRVIDGRLIRSVIQTDAAVNPGNSGGPLLDSSGKMIGINNAIFSPVGASIGIGFAVPVNTAKEVIPQLIERGHVSRPWLGITGQQITPELAKLLKLPSDGILVAKVEKDSPADKIGIKGGENIVTIGNLQIITGGDMIVAFAGKDVKNMDYLIEEIESRAIGESVDIVILRDGDRKILKVNLTEPPLLQL